MDWADEMDRMLIAFEREAKFSLARIEVAFNHSGLRFNSKFKKHFMEASNARLEQTYNQFEFKSQMKEDIFGRTSSNTLRTTSNGRTINLTNVKSELEDQSLNLIEIGDSSDEEGATERAHTSNESMRKAKPQMGSLVDLSNAPNKSGRLEQRNISITVTKRANEVNAFHIGSRAGTSGEERCIRSDVVGNVVNAPAGSCNDDATNSVRSISPMIVEGQNGTLNKNGRRSEDNVLSEGASKGNQQRNTKACATDKKRQTNKTTMVASYPRPAMEQSTSNRLKCRHCAYVGSHMGNLAIHMRKHTGEKPYRCDRCGKRFTTTQQLKMHTVTHTDVFPFHCKGCYRVFPQKDEKEAHDKECMARRYECHLCKKFVTSFKTSMKKHMRKHTGEKPFCCEICMKHFTEKGSLKIHLNTIHAR